MTVNYKVNLQDLDNIFELISDVPGAAGDSDYEWTGSIEYTFENGSSVDLAQRYVKRDKGSTAALTKYQTVHPTLSTPGVDLNQLFAAKGSVVASAPVITLHDIAYGTSVSVEINESAIERWTVTGADNVYWSYNLNGGSFSSEISVAHSTSAWRSYSTEGVRQLKIRGQNAFGSSVSLVSMDVEGISFDFSLYKPNSNATYNTYVARTKITWDRGTFPIEAYTSFHIKEVVIYRDSTPVQTIPFTPNGSWNDDNRSFDTNYNYQIKFIDNYTPGGIESIISNVDVGRQMRDLTGIAYSEINNLTAESNVSSDYVRLRWPPAVAGATGYKIYRTPQSGYVGPPPSTPGGTVGNITQADDYSVPDTNPHLYWIRAINGNASDDTPNAVGSLGSVSQYSNAASGELKPEALVVHTFTSPYMVDEFGAIPVTYDFSGATGQSFDIIYTRWFGEGTAISGLISPVRQGNCG